MMNVIVKFLWPTRMILSSSKFLIQIFLQRYCTKVVDKVWLWNQKMSKISRQWICEFIKTFCTVVLIYFNHKIYVNGQLRNVTIFNQLRTQHDRKFFNTTKNHILSFLINTLKIRVSQSSNDKITLIIFLRTDKLLWILLNLTEQENSGWYCTFANIKNT